MGRHEGTFNEISEIETDIMVFISWWVHTEKTPIPLKQIVKAMKKKEYKSFSTINAINSLIRKGYIRRSVVVSSRTSFVQLRSI